MHIDQPDSFRLWLESVLSPLCDADPVALARYVYALVRKDKPAEELRGSMVDQLDVFLQKETKSFVALMFKTIDNKEYVTFKKEVPTKDEKKEAVVKDDKKDVGSKEEPTSSVEQIGKKLEPERKEAEEGISSSEEKPPSQIQSSVISESTEKEVDKKEELHKKEVEREERFRLNRSKLKATGPGWNTRSRSRSWERGRRSRSRERLDMAPRDRELPLRDRERLDGPPRDRERLDGAPRDRERGDGTPRDRERPDGTPRDRERPDGAPRDRERLDGAPRDRERPDGPPRDRERLDGILRDRERERLRDRPRLYRNKSPPRRYERRRSYNSKSPSPVRYRGSRSKSRSPKFRRFRNRSPTRSRSRSRSRESSYERRGSPQKGDGLKDMGDDDRRIHMSGGNGRRCRDFDVRGYCLRGELCQYDHGKDPVVVNELNIPATLSYGVNQPPGGPGVMQGGPPMPQHMPPVGPPMHMFQSPPPMIMRPPPMEYNPDAPSLNPNMSWGRPPFHPRGGPRMMHGMPFPPPNQRDLINVSTDGYRTDNMTRGNCSLDIRKIPRCLNTITNLNNHFAKFGTIVNIQINLNNDPESATITFSSPMQAHAAYKSTEAVLNNRFIKVFWHGSSNHNSRGNNVRDRLGTPQNPPPVAVASAPPSEPSVNLPVANPNVSSKSNVWGAKQKAAGEIMLTNQIIQKKRENTRKEAMVLSSELRKRSQNLMDKQIEQQKELLKKLETGGLEEKQRAAFIETIKHLQESIEKLKNEIMLGAKEVVKPLPKTKEQIQKEILDTEMDIIKAQQEGGDVLPLQKTLGQLKVELLRLQQAVLPPVVIPPTKVINYSPYTYNSAQQSRTQATFTVKPIVDYRPTKILVSGYENDDKDLVLTHFKKFGEVVDYISDDSTPSIVLNYKNRVEAQIAMTKGKSFQDRLLSITWFSDPQLPPQRSENSETPGFGFYDEPGAVKIKQEVDTEEYEPDRYTFKRNSSTSNSSYHMHAGRQVLLSGNKTKKEIKGETESADEEIASEGPDLETNDDFLLQDDDDDDEERSWRR